MKQRFRKFLLVVPPFWGPNVGSKSMVGTGAGYLLEYLEHKSISHSYLDMRLDNREKKLFDKIKRFKPDLVGFQIMTFRKDIPFKIIKNLKKEFPKINIVVGGPHISCDKTKVMQIDEIDYAIKHEGEETLFDLMNGVPINKINGLIHRKNGKIIDNLDRKFIKELDKIPFPKYKDFDMKKYDPVIPIITSRGCPYQCAFCPIKTSIGMKFRYRNPKNLIKEIDYWYKKGYRSFQILDDNFTLLIDRVIEFCELVNAKFKDVKFALPNGIRADRVTKELFIKLKKAGFDNIAIAVESANDRVLKVIKKGETMKEIDEAIKNATEIGFDVELFFIIGNPTETEKEIENSFKFAQKYPVSEAKFYNLIPFPNTELFRWVEQNAKFCGDIDEMLTFHAHRSMQPFFETKDLSFKKRRELLIKGEHIRKKILRKNLQRKLARIGILSHVLAYIFFLKPIHKLIEVSYQQRLIRHTIQKAMKIFNIQVKNF